MDDGLKITLQYGPFDYLSKYTLMLLIFLLPLDSFATKQKIPQNNKQCIYCWLNISSGQRY